MGIYGECQTDSWKLRVRILQLTSKGCDLVAEDFEFPCDGHLSLWIGAIGPLSVRVTRRDKTRVSAVFDEELDPRILKHFTTDLDPSEQ